MVDFQINTSRLTLIPFTIPMLESIKKGPESFFALTSFDLPLKFTEFPDSMDYTIAHFTKIRPEIPWTSYAIIFNAENTYAGQGGFKSSPDPEGNIELGYEIAEPFRLKGLANETIEALIDIAFGKQEINRIVAHTLAEQNISNHLLIKHGFVFEMALEDAEDGKIWKWTLSRSVYHLRKLMHTV
ncbi:MAG: GNAT family protein [Saprospiraceae bacterium]